jgi:hypothetical protein
MHPASSCAADQQLSLSPMMMTLVLLLAAVNGVLLNAC